MEKMFIGLFSTFHIFCKHFYDILANCTNGLSAKRIIGQDGLTLAKFFFVCLFMDRDSVETIL